MATGRIPTTANSPLTAKGDLFTFSTGSAKLAVGNNGETLVANSSTATGLAYIPTFFAGKNKIINGDFNIWQRGTSFALSSTAAYTCDRYNSDSGSMNYTFSRQSFTAGTAPVAGYESAFFFRALATSGSGGFPKIQQKIEDVRTYAGQTVTLSFYAKASSAITVSPDIIQDFGSGGSSSVFVGSVATSITTSWVRYSITYTVPSISGKTIGTSSSLIVSFNLPNSGTASFDTWGWQLESGSSATAFQTATGTIQGELAACQRYYYAHAVASGEQIGSAVYNQSTESNAQIKFPVTMRTTPTLSATTGASNYVIIVANNNDVFNSLIIFGASLNAAGVYNASESSGTAGTAGRMQINNSSGFVAFVSEL